MSEDGIVVATIDYLSIRRYVLTLYRNDPKLDCVWAILTLFTAL